MGKEKKYKANVKKFDEILEAMPFKKSDFEKNIKVAGCGSRVFSYLSLGQKKYPIEIFEKLADEFQKQYKLIDPKKIIKTKDLIDPKNTDEGLKNWLMTDEFSCVLRRVDKANHLTQAVVSPNVKRVFINHTRTNYEIANCIKNIFIAIDDAFKSKEREGHFLGNMKSDDQINDLKVEAEINGSLDLLSTKHGVSLYYGDLISPLLGFEQVSGGMENNAFSASINVNIFNIFLISYNLETDPKVIYKAELPFPSLIDASSFVMENPLTVVEDESTGILQANQITFQLQEQYYKKYKKLFPIYFEKDKLIFKNLELVEYIDPEEYEEL